MVKPMIREKEVTAPLSQLLTVIERFREMDTEMQTQTVAVFLCVAKSPMPVRMSVIADETGLAQSSISRNVALLSQWSRHQVKGQGLLEAYEDPTERRRKLVRLTKKGEKFAKSIADMCNH